MAIPTPEQIDKFKKKLDELTVEEIQEKLDIGAIGYDWKRKFAERTIIDRTPAAKRTDHWFSKSNIMGGVYTAAAIAATALIAWFFRG